MYFWQWWRRKDIVNVTFQTLLCIRLYERIVKNGAGNECGTSNIRQEEVSESLKLLITFTLRYSTMKQKLILI